MNTIFYIYRVTSQTVNQGHKQEREKEQERKRQRIMFKEIF